MKNVVLALALLGSCTAASATQGTLSRQDPAPNGTLCTYTAYTQEGAITGSIIVPYPRERRADEAPQPEYLRMSLCPQEIDIYQPPKTGG